MRTAVVLGGNGFLGTHIASGLVSDGWRVRVIDRSPPLSEADRGVEWIDRDLCDHAPWAEMLTDSTVVIHGYSTTTPTTSDADPVYDVESNLLSTLRILDACATAGVSRFVFVSSGGAVYGIPRALPVREDHPLAPISSYGIVKAAVESYVRHYCTRLPMTYAILRPGNPFGVGQVPGRGQGVIPTYLKALLDRTPIRMFGDGEQVRDYLYVNDVARGCVLAASSPRNLVLNLGSGRGLSLNSLLQILTSVTQIEPVRIDHLPSRSSDIRALILDTARAEAELNWRPEVPILDGIRLTWQWVRSIDGGR